MLRAAEYCECPCRPSASIGRRTAEIERRSPTAEPHPLPRLATLSFRRAASCSLSVAERFHADETGTRWVRPGDETSPPTSPPPPKGVRSRRTRKWSRTATARYENARTYTPSASGAAARNLWPRGRISILRSGEEAEFSRV
jgi:hypothetical protein